MNDNAVVIGADALADLIAGFARSLADVASRLFGNDVNVTIGAGPFGVVIFPAQVAQTVVLFNCGFVIEFTNFPTGDGSVLEVLTFALVDEGDGLGSARFAGRQSDDGCVCADSSTTIFVSCFCCVDGVGGTVFNAFQRCLGTRINGSVRFGGGGVVVAALGVLLD